MEDVMYPSGDTSLVEAFRSGDESVMRRLVKDHHRELLLHAFRLVRNEADAEEIVQEAFLRVYRTRSEFRGDCSLRTWLYRVTSNLALNHLKRRKREEVVEEAPEVAVESNGLTSMLSEEQTRHLRAAMEALPPKQKLVLTLRVHQDMSLQEIADHVGAPLGTVKANLFHAMKNVEKYLKPYFPEAGT